MKKEYEKPTVELLNLVSEETIANGDNIGAGGLPSMGGEDVEDW